MKKTVVMLTVVMLVSLMFTGFALANDAPERPVSDVEAPDPGEEDYVGKDMELGEGEMGIVSVDGLEAEEASGNLPLYGGLAVVGGALALFVYRKKIA
ncbi:hypothetical protein [Dethiobacter alkaliphilus]|uniref:hypothetical protein n=1 Tax=Dethiobacter alkaliphilus TaxID=427926 RepID=UPI002225BB53|nr:hypothetical protein [Dethiobacter alkaliphilus]MCW3491005.1 hypothetical protein [Dethiobacter alkaliphilus]